MQRKSIEAIYIKKIKELLLENDAKYAGLTGSGACVFGVYEDMGVVEEIYDRNKGRFAFIKVCQSF